VYISGVLAILIMSGTLFLSACVEKTEYDVVQKKLDDGKKERPRILSRSPKIS
jgi:hypothetical protein